MVKVYSTWLHQLFKLPAMDWLVMINHVYKELWIETLTVPSRWHSFQVVWEQIGWISLSPHQWLQSSLPQLLQKPSGRKTPAELQQSVRVLVREIIIEENIKIANTGLIMNT